MKIKRSNTSPKKLQKMVPTLFGSLVLLIVTGLLFQIFVYGVKTDNHQTVFADTTETVTMSPQNYTDYANEDGSTFTQPSSAGSTMWMGNGQSKDKSYLGIRFSGATIPKGSQITSASLEFVPKETSWISLSNSFGAELNTTPDTYSSNKRPSSRVLSTKKQAYSDNVKWLANTKYKYDITGVIQSLGTTADRSVINVVVKGTGPSWGRKFVTAGIGAATGPKLSVTFRTSIQPSPSPVVTTASTATIQPTATIIPSSTIKPSPTKVVVITPTPTIGQSNPTSQSTGGESMAMMAWRVGGKNTPNPKYDKCDDGTDVVAAHNQYYVIAYDGIKYPTWHPPVVTNPITGNGKCYFGHEHGTNPQGYQYWNEIVQHFGKDTNNDGVITPMIINSNGQITPGDRAGLPFGIANEHMDQYYNKEGRDSIFVRHEDHVGHKIEFVNGEADMNGNSTHVMQPLNTTGGVNIPYYKGTDSNTYFPTGVKCTHLHKFHQGTSSGDAIRNNLHEVVFHSTCTSTRSEYPGNTVLLTGMMSFGNPGGYVRFCGANRSLLVCPDGKNPDGSCKVTDPLISKLPDAVHSNTLGRNMVDRSCLSNVDQLSGSFYFNPYEIWQGDLQITRPDGKMLAEHGRQWDVLDPIRFIDPNSATGFSYNSEQCGPGGLLHRRTLNCEINGEYKNTPWDSPQSGFKGLKRTTYFGRNRVSNPGGAQVWWTDPLGGNAVVSAFGSGLKQRFSSVEADICKLPECSKLNDRAIQRTFDSGGNTVHAPN